MNLLNDNKNKLWKSKNVIYCYTNLINGKKYVGQTKQTLKARHNNHMADSKNETRKGSYKNVFHTAIRKYGIENFSLEILSFADEYSLNLLEIYYIEKFDLLNRNKGYNIKTGGSNGNPYAGQTEYELIEHKNKISKALKGKEKSQNAKNNMKLNHANVNGKNNPNSSSVAQYDLDGNLIKIWDCINEAKKELKINNISACCRGVQNTAGGYIWKYYTK